MRMERCANGHFYDAEKYSSCPYCSGGNNNETVGLAPGDFKTSAVTGAAGFSESDDVTQAETPDEDLQVNLKDQGRRMSVNNIPFPASEPAYDDGATVAYFSQPGPADQQQMSAKSSSAGNPVVGWLVCTSGINFGKCYSLFTGKNFIGRSPQHDVYLQGDNAISRDIHAIVTYEPKQCQFYAQPGDSHALFYVNDEVVLGTVKLNDRDQLTLGNTVLRFVPFCDERFNWEANRK